MEVSTERAGTRDFDTILIGVGMDIPLAPPGIISYLKEASTTTRRLASICLGSSVLGEAGLLQQRRATTHWRFADEFQRRFPETQVEIDRIFVADGPVWTSAGMSARMDLALSFVENDHGRELAKNRPGFGHTSPASGRAIAAFGTIGAGRQVRSSTDYAGVCQAKSALGSEH